MRNWITIVLIVVVAGLAGLVIYLNTKIDKIVVIDVIKVVNEFDLKKELDTRADKKLGFYTGKLDSLKIVFDKSVNDKVKQDAQTMYTRIEQDFQYALEVANNNINEQVWKRLNPLIDDFGKEKGYRVIIGANGMGSVLYRSDAIDRTSELIKFINKKYATGS